MTSGGYYQDLTNQNLPYHLNPNVTTLQFTNRCLPPPYTKLHTSTYISRERERILTGTGMDLSAVAFVAAKVEAAVALSPLSLFGGIYDGVAYDGGG